MTNNKQADLELTSEMLERNDIIDNAVYDLILTLAEKSRDELDWSMEIIGEVTDAVKEVLSRFKLRVRHPGIVTYEDGSQAYDD